MAQFAYGGCVSAAKIRPYLPPFDDGGGGTTGGKFDDRFSRCECYVSGGEEKKCIYIYILFSTFLVFFLKKKKKEKER